MPTNSKDRSRVGAPTVADGAMTFVFSVRVDPSRAGGHVRRHPHGQHVPPPGLPGRRRPAPERAAYRQAAGEGYVAVQALRPPGLNREKSLLRGLCRAQSGY